jgi:hypothetical protein
MQPQKVGASVTKKSNLRLDRKMSKFGIITRPITFDFSIFNSCLDATLVTKNLEHYYPLQMTETFFLRTKKTGTFFERHHYDSQSLPILVPREKFQQIYRLRDTQFDMEEVLCG